MFQRVPFCSTNLKYKFEISHISSYEMSHFIYCTPTTLSEVINYTVHNVIYGGTCTCNIQLFIYYLSIVSKLCTVLRGLKSSTVANIEFCMVYNTFILYHTISPAIPLIIMNYESRKAVMPFQPPRSADKNFFFLLLLINSQ